MLLNNMSNSKFPLCSYSLIIFCVLKSSHLVCLTILWSFVSYCPVVFFCVFAFCFSISDLMKDQAKEGKVDQEFNKITAEYSKLCGMDVGSPNATSPTITPRAACAFLLFSEGEGKGFITKGFVSKGFFAKGFVAKLSTHDWCKWWWY